MCYTDVSHVIVSENEESQVVKSINLTQVRF